MVLDRDKNLTRIGYKNYDSYLTSDHWKNIRASMKSRIIEGCQCGVKKNLVIHHKNYSCLGNEDLNKDLVVLCWRCHRDAHGFLTWGELKTVNDERRGIKRLFTYLYLGVLSGKSSTNIKDHFEKNKWSPGDVCAIDKFITDCRRFFDSPVFGKLEQSKYSKNNPFTFSRK